VDALPKRYPHSYSNLIANTPTIVNSQQKFRSGVRKCVWKCLRTFLELQHYPWPATFPHIFARLPRLQSSFAGGSTHNRT